MSTKTDNFDNKYRNFLQYLTISSTQTTQNGRRKLFSITRYLLTKTTRFDRGDLCGFTWNNKLLIKRVIGLPGDYIEIDTDGTVYVNGDKLDEPYVKNKSLGECDLEFPFQVPVDQYFVIGDMRESSIDSRNSLIGCVARDQIVGKVFFRVWPFKGIRFF